MIINFDEFDTEEIDSNTRYRVVPFCLKDITQDQMKDIFRVGDRLLVSFEKRKGFGAYKDLIATVTYTGVPIFVDHYLITLKFDTNINGHCGINKWGALDNCMDTHHWNFSKRDNYSLCVTEVLYEEQNK